MECLKKLNQLCNEKGWKGTGIWVTAHPVNYQEKKMISGKLIEEIGCSTNKKQDFSGPGLILKLEKIE